MDIRFDGAGVALVTPFDSEGVNESVLRALVRFHIDEGTDALIICGSTGEAAAMSAAEQGIAARVAVEAAAGEIPIIVGCGGSDTKQVAKLAAQAAQAGADGVLLSAPPYNKPPQRGLVAHFRAVVDEGGIPAILYNVPSRSAVNILPSTIAELADDTRFVGVKEASGDISQIAEVARLVGDRMHIWSGNDDQVIPVLALGGRGVISVLGNVAPGPTSRMVHTYLEGNAGEALRMQLAFLPLIRMLFTEPNPIPVKMGVEWLGFDVGALRLPLVRADDAFRSKLIEAMRSAGLAQRS
jgi:4-hydroxy-tetrahydrodipicolinate synthase